MVLNLKMLVTQIIQHHVISGAHRPTESHSWVPMRCTLTRIRGSAILSTDDYHNSYGTYLLKSVSLVYKLLEARVNLTRLGFSST